MAQFIETQFPIARLSAESFKERKAGASQTLTGLGKWWGRKPLILCRAAIIGMLMPATDDLKKDREIFLKILTMDDDGAWHRCIGEVPAGEWRKYAPDTLQSEFFTARGFKAGLSDEERIDICDQIWEALTPEQRHSLDASRRRPISDRKQFDALPYAERIKHCQRPEQIVGPNESSWAQINAHLNTSATTLRELVAQLGQRLFGRVPCVGDAFCGGGSIPFEAARIGCEAFGSDLNPVAGFLTHSSIYLLGGGNGLHEEIKKLQAADFTALDNQTIEWAIEQNQRGERAEAFLYCVEVKPEGSDYYIPLAPNWVVSEKYHVVAVWERSPGSDRLEPQIKAVSPAEFADFKKGKKGATVIDNRAVDPFDNERSWSLEALRGPDGLRRWTNEDLVPRRDDVFQERLYCIRWIDSDGNRRYAAPSVEDLEREDRVLALLKERFQEWQTKGFIPSLPIPEGGDKTEEPIRTRGWTHWHHLFNPRQLLLLGTLASSKIDVQNEHSLIASADRMLRIGSCSNWHSKLCSWDPWLSKSGGIGAVHQVFYNQALNPMFNYVARGLHGLRNFIEREYATQDHTMAGTVTIEDARDVSRMCDLWITDPPYADAVCYHELGDFFLAWYDKQLKKLFPDWPIDARAELAVRGEDDSFRHSMVTVYKNLTSRMPDNGMQMVMFTHQNPAVWADLGMILWAAGLKATAAWTISTETEAAGIKKGSYVQGTVCLVLRKRLGSEPGFLDEIYPMVEDEVRRQIDSMKALDEDSEPNFNDADYQLAAYAAALKVLTQYSNIDGRDVEHEVFALRERNQKSDFQTVIERALGIACDYLVPKGLEHSWRDLSLTERYYLRALDIESRGERRKGMYEELARGFGVTDIRPLLESDKANGARMKTPSGFGATLLVAPDGTTFDTATLPSRRTRSNTGSSHPFSSSPLRHLLFAIRETATSDNNPEQGRQYLRDTFGSLYWNKRERCILLLDWLALLGNAAGMEEWSNDCEAARILAGRLRNDHA